VEKRKLVMYNVNFKRKLWIDYGIIIKEE